MAKGKSNLIVEIGGQLAASFKKTIKQTQMSVSGLGKNISREMNQAATSASKGFKNVIRNDAFQSAAVGAAAIGTGIMSSVRAAMEFESAMADVKKVVDFDTPKQFKDMQRDILQLSKTIPLSATGFAEIVAAAGQAGVAKEELNRFAKSAAEMAVAFDISAGEAGDAMAKFRTSMGLSQDEVEALADSINHLSNNYASSASEITNYMNRVGALKGQMAITEQSIAAFGSTMIASGAAPEVAATSFRNLTKALMSGDNATKKQRLAFQQLGLSATQVASDMQKDAEGTILKVFDNLGKAPAELRASLSTQLFGSEARALVPLLTQTDKLKEALDSVADAELFKGSMLAEFEARSKTAANQQQLFRNNMNALGIAIGTSVLPAINSFFNAITPVVNALSTFAADNPVLTQGIVLLGGAFTALVAVTPFIASMISVLGSLKLALIGASAAGTVAGGVLAILGSPITLTIAAIAGLTAGFVALYNNVDWFRNGVHGILDFLGAAWQGFASLVTTVWSAAVDYLMPIFQAWGTMFNGIVQAIQGVWQVFTGIFTGDSQTAVEGVQNIFGGLGTFFSGWVDGLFAAFAPITGILTGAFQSAVEFLRPIINGISAIFGNVVQIVQGYWQVFTSLFQGDFAGAAAGIEAIVGGFQGIFGIAINGIKALWTGLVGHVQNIGGQIVSFFMSLPGKLADVGKAIIDTIKDGIVARFSALKDTVVSSFTELRKLLPFSDAKKGPFKDLTKSGRSIMTTLADGVRDRQSTLKRAMTEAANVTGTAFDNAFAPSVSGPQLAFAGATFSGSQGGGAVDNGGTIAGNLLGPEAFGAARQRQATATLAPVVNISVANANASPEEIATVVTTALEEMLSDAESDQRAGLND